MDQISKAQYGLALAVAMCLLPVVGVLAPRAISFLPAIIGLFAFVAYRPVFNMRLMIKPEVFIALGAVVALMALSSLWAVDMVFALDRAARTAGIFLGGALLIHMMGAVELDSRFDRWFPVAFIAAAALSLVDLYGDGTIYRSVHGGLEGALNPSSFNRGIIVLSLCFFPVLSMIRRSFEGRAHHIWLGVILVLMAAILYKTQSQSAQMALLVGAVFYFAFPTRVKAAWQILTAVLLVMIWGAPWIAQAMFKYLPPLVENVAWFQESWAAHRMEIWDFIARRALENPLYGFGVEVTRFTTDFDTQELYHPSAQILHPHNFVLQWWIEFGALGMVVMSGVLGWLILKIQKLNADYARLALACLFTAISVAATGYGFWQSWWLGLLFLAAALSVERRPVA